MTLSGDSSSTSSEHSSSSSKLRKRPEAVKGSKKMSETSAQADASPPSQQLPEMEAEAVSPEVDTPPSWIARNQWVVYAVASGGCAAFNGAFAKLTTNDLTAHIAQGISGVLGLTTSTGIIEVVVRCIFFGLNLVFNGVMWTLFTQALAKGHSTTQVSIMNTSTNFMVTALLGLMIFAESLPPLWWLGAAMLVAGNVIVGRKDEGSANKGDEILDRSCLLDTSTASSESTEDGRVGRQSGYGSLPQDGRI